MVTVQTNGDVAMSFASKLTGVRPADSEQWRVTDPNVNTTTYPAAADFLPNPEIPLTVDDLDGAIRAEATMIIWGGHISTYGKYVCFNGNA